MQTKDEILALLQGKWELADSESKNKVKFEIRDEHIIPINAAFPDEIVLKYEAGIKKWRFTALNYTLINAFIEDINDFAFTLYNYKAFSGTPIDADDNTGKLLNPDSIYKFYRVK